MNEIPDLKSIKLEDVKAIFSQIEVIILYNEKLLVKRNKNELK